MKRIIHASSYIDLGKYARYFQIDDSSTWDLPDADEVVDWYKKTCEKNGYKYLALIEAKDPYYSGELDKYSALILSRDANGQLVVLDALSENLYDVTDEVDGIINKIDASDISVSRTITYEDIRRAEQVLIDNGIEEDEAYVVLQAIGYTLLDTELYPED